MRARMEHGTRLEVFQQQRLFSVPRQPQTYSRFVALTAWRIDCCLAHLSKRSTQRKEGRRWRWILTSGSSTEIFSDPCPCQCWPSARASATGIIILFWLAWLSNSFYFLWKTLPRIPEFVSLIRCCQTPVISYRPGDALRQKRAESGRPSERSSRFLDLTNVS